MAEYIDKEQVVQYLYNQAEALDEAGGSFMAAVHAQGWADAIKKWPAADVRPTVHAHWELCVERTISIAGWVTDTAFHRCSKCHGRPGNGGIGLFCMFCGAIMDEEIKQ